MAGTMTSSPGPTPRARIAQCSAAVPELTATPSRAWQKSAKACSKRETRGPVVSQSDVSASTTARISGSAISCRPYGRKACLMTVSSGIGHGEQRLQPARIQLFRVCIAGIVETVHHRLATTMQIGVARRIGEALQDDIAIFQLDRAMGVIGRDHGLMQLFTGAD